MWRTRFSANFAGMLYSSITNDRRDTFSLNFEFSRWLFKDAQDKVMDFDQDDDEGKMLFLHRLDPSRSSLVRPGLSPE